MNEIFLNETTLRSCGLECEDIGSMQQTVGKQFEYWDRAPEVGQHTNKDRALDTFCRRTPKIVRHAIFRIRQTVRGLMGRPDPRDVFNNMDANREERKRWAQQQQQESRST